MEGEFIIYQSLDEKTLQKASAKILFSSRIIIYVIVLMLFFATNAITSIKEYQEGTANAVTFIPFLIPIIVLGGIWYSTRRSVSKTYKKSPRYFTGITFTLTPDALKLNGQDFENTSPWQNYHKIKETQDWFMIFINKTQAHVIDKAQLKGFTTEDLRAFFRALPPKIKVSLKN